MSVLDGIDVSDPCAVWPKLQECLLRLIAGEGVVRARFGDDEVEYRQTSIAELRAEVARLKGECEAKAAGTPRRFAMVGRMHPRRGYY